MFEKVAGRRSKILLLGHIKSGRCEGRVGLQLPSTVSELSARLADVNVADLNKEAELANLLNIEGLFFRGAGRASKRVKMATYLSTHCGR